MAADLTDDLLDLLPDPEIIASEDPLVVNSGYLSLLNAHSEPTTVGRLFAHTLDLPTSSRWRWMAIDFATAMAVTTDRPEAYRLLAIWRAEFPEDRRREFWEGYLNKQGSG